MDGRKLDALFYRLRALNCPKAESTQLRNKRQSDGQALALILLLIVWTPTFDLSEDGSVYIWSIELDNLLSKSFSVYF